MSSKRRSGKGIEQRAGDVLISIARIQTFVAGMDRGALCDDQKTRSAVERELLTISEACRAMHDLEKAQAVAADARLEARFPLIPWPAIRGIGNILRHDYGRVDADVLWSTIAGDDLNRLKNALLEAFPS